MANSFNLPFSTPQNQQPPGGMPGGEAPLDRAQRSVFVGNIPYDATEEQLRDVFEQAGPVKSFRLVYDRESGKPKGYGFCEYQDIETAQSAMRNLNNVDFNGRPLRVGVAAGEQTKDDSKNMQQALGAQALESPYGEPMAPEKAPEAISQAVASLPPEQMFELMKQMKLCIQNNPNEARNMLMQNPQLAYALLQAQIVMKIVDPQVAMSMLYRDETQPKVNMKPPGPPGPGNVRPPQPHQPSMVPPPMQQPHMQQPPMSQPQMQQPPMSQPQMQQASRPPMQRPPMPQPQRPPMDMGNPNRFPPNRPQNMGGPGPRQVGPPGPRPVGPPGPGPQGPPQGGPGGPPASAIPPVPRPPAPPVLPPASSSSQSSSAAAAAAASGGSVTSQDQEKAALIMQVLQLTDEQIALLPPEQRQSILILKEQIKSG